MSSTVQNNKDGFAKWMDQIDKNRVIDCGKSIAEYPFASCRIRKICGLNFFKELSNDELKGVTKSAGTKGPVVYWMNRDQRVQDNWALLFAQRIAMKFSVPLDICFNLLSSPAIQTRRHANFLLEGLTEIEQASLLLIIHSICDSLSFNYIEECKDLNIGFHVLFETGAAKPKTGGKRKADGETAANSVVNKKLTPLINFLSQVGARVIITDFSPLRDDLHLLDIIKDQLPEDIPFYQIDAHNVIPVWFASDKMEYAARTIRPKLHEKAKALFTNFPPVVTHPCVKQTGPVNWSKIKEFLNSRVIETVEAVDKYKGGSKAGFFQLYTFLHNRLSSYGKDRNDPTKDALSNLSPWFHFGKSDLPVLFLSFGSERSLRMFGTEHCIRLWFRREIPIPCLLTAFTIARTSSGCCLLFSRPPLLPSSLLPPHLCNMLVGKILRIFIPLHIRFNPAIGSETLRKHSNDIRQPAYSEEKMESASTGDELWNAAQRQLVYEGKIHGFLRMYWAKKILEWHAGGPEKALQLGIHLLHTYSSFLLGVMWSICGIHDQGWVERPVFGKIRFMNFAGCKRKFDVTAFIKKYPPPVNKHFKA
ncbi:unnamed protein product [Hymenolepis diminuta]|uniref:Deoxyribodipyrimidine photo-lyase n=2 Tax=Hymenolepis diminuta TaxID=6216 RepID=A0A158QBM2_HYMDI|nr:unnamed protein product [Hymenolepis diminuta]